MALSIFFSQATALFPVIELSYWSCEGLCRAHWSFEMLGGSSPRVVPIINRLPLQHPTEDCYTFASALKKIEGKLLWKSPKSACSPSIQPCQPCPKPPALSQESTWQESLDCTWRAMTTLKYQKVWQTILVRLMMGSFQPSIHRMFFPHDWYVRLFRLIIHSLSLLES